MQRIFLAIALTIAASGEATAEETLPESGALACSIEGDIGLIGWKPGSRTGEIEMLGAMAGETAQQSGDALIVVREGLTIVLRADRAEFVSAAETRQGSCALVTDEVLDLAAALN